MNQQDQLKQPFFAKLMENQKSTQPDESQNFIGIITGKFLDDIEHTLKYPSDNDEI